MIIPEICDIIKDMKNNTIYKILIVTLIFITILLSFLSYYYKKSHDSLISEIKNPPINTTSFPTTQTVESGDLNKNFNFDLGPIASLNSMYNISSTTENGAVDERYDKIQLKYSEANEKILGCFYSSENINYKVKFDRNGNYVWDIEGLTRFVSTYGGYGILPAQSDEEMNNILSGILNIKIKPQDESSFLIKFYPDNNNQIYFEKTESDGHIIRYNKGSCAEYYNY